MRAKETRMEAAVAAVLPELDGIFLNGGQHCLALPALARGLLNKAVHSG